MNLRNGESILASIHPVRRRLCVLALMLAPFPSSRAFAQAEDPEFTSAREAVSRFVRGFDRDAVVVLDLKELRQAGAPDQAETLSLPGMAGLRLAGGEVASGKRTLSAEIYTKIKALPPESEGIIRKILRPYAGTVVFSYRRPLAGFKDPQLVSVPEAKAAQQAPVAAQSPAVEIPDYTNLIEGVSTQLLRRLEAAALLAGGAISLLALLLGGHLWQMRKQTKVIEGGMRRLAAIAEAGGGGGRTINAQAIHDLPRAQNPLLPNGRSDPGVFDGFSDEALAALVTDCYWSEADSYGAFVWRNTPQGTRHALMRKFAFLHDYASYLTEIEALNLNLEQDPYYLEPLHFEHLDSAALTGLVQSNPQLYHRISSLRKGSLRLTTAEKLALESDFPPHSGLRPAVPDGSVLAASRPRSLTRRGVIKVGSVEEERDLLAIENLLPEQMAQVPSLVWTKYVGKDDLNALLNRFSAEDLAAAWIGPEEILGQLEESIPERKMALIKNYARRVRPGRDSAAFLALHHAIVATIKANRTGEVDSDEQRFAA